MTGGTELAGHLRERVTLEDWVSARDEVGADAGQWALSGSFAAAVEAERGSLRDRQADGEALRSVSRWRVTLRAPVDVRLTTRLWWRGERLTVLAVERDPLLAEMLVLRCRSAG